MKTNVIYRLYLTVSFVCIFLLYLTLIHNKAYLRNKGESCLKYDEIHLYKKDYIFSNFTLHDNETCKQQEVKLSTVKLPVTGLVSFPGSGNTWTRHLIQQLTGLATSSIYCDEKLRNGGFPFECYPEINKTIVVKTHSFYGSEQFDRIILMIRNPFEAFLSSTNYMYCYDHTAHAPQERLKFEIRRRFEQMLKEYVDLIVNVTSKFNGDVYVLQYEHLKSDMVIELNNLAVFLKADVTHEDIQCTVRLQEGNFHRNKNDTRQLALIREVYSPSKLKRMQRVARLVGYILKKTYDIDIDIGGETEDMLLNDENIYYDKYIYRVT